MNRGNYTGRAQQSVPLSTYGLDFIQQQILLAAEMAKIAGYNCILSGCEEAGNNVAPGTLIINGEILPFLGGTKQSKVRIVQTAESVTAATETYDQLYVRRHVEFGANLNDVNTFNWSDFTAVLTSKYVKDNVVFNTRKINEKSLIEDIVLSPEDIGAATAEQGTKADSALQSKLTAKTLVTPYSNGLISTNRLYWYIDDVGYFVLNGNISLSSIPENAFNICYLPLKTNETNCIFPFYAGNYLGGHIVSIVVWPNKEAYLYSYSGGGFYYLNFNYRIPTLGKVIDNGVTKYLV
jgi:hypothetical protein